MSGYHNHYNDNSFVRGQTSIDWQVRQAVEDLQRKGGHVVTAAKHALKEGADIILADMNNRAPVRTGRLKASIKAEPLENGAIYQFSANARNPRDNFLYGQIVEFSEWHMWKGKNKGHMSFADMMDARREEVNQMIKRAIDTAIARGH